MEQLLNSVEFRKYINADKDQAWQECTGMVHYFLIDDYQKMYGHYLKEILN